MDDFANAGDSYEDDDDGMSMTTDVPGTSDPDNNNNTKTTPPGMGATNNTADEPSSSRYKRPYSNYSDPYTTKDPGKAYRFHISKHIDDNRDLYFIKLVAGALKRRSFQSLIEVEEIKEGHPTPVSYMTVRVKYSYNNELLYAWSTSIEKVKNMIEKSKVGLKWNTSDSIHEAIINNDTAVSAFARYVAFIIMTETNNFIPMNRTRYVLTMTQQLEGERVLNLMRALHSEFKILRSDLIKRYNIH
jgi:hypothetical protein